MKYEYIDNDKNKGIKYDWNKVYKELDKMKIIPNNVYYPKFNFYKNKWNVVCSERSIGKTTNVLLLGMILNKMYGTIIHYIREDEDMIRQSAVKDLFDIIISHDYIRKITDNKYNDVLYNKTVRRWYYCNTDENGIVTEKSNTHFMINMSIDNNERYKSSYNCDKGDFVIFDEFISKRYCRNDFIDFCDLLKTIFRDRLSPVIIMLANTIDKSSEYFDELEVREFIETLNIGEKIDITTDKGTNIHLEIYGNSINSNSKKRINKEFFGFNNPRLNSITGGEWATSSYPHITFDNVNVLYRNIFIKTKNKYVQIDIAKTEIGLVALLHMSNEPKNENAYIYTNDYIYDNREVYKFGNGSKLDKLIWNDLFKNNKFYYANNQVGALVENYINISNRL